MWSFAAAPGSLPLLKETPLSGYLPGNPVPAEWSWMEPRLSTVLHGNRTEMCVPPLSHMPRVRAMPVGPHKAVPNPCPCIALNLPQKHLFSSTTCFSYTTLAAHNRRSSHGPSPPPPPRYSWINSLCPTLTAMGASNKALQLSPVLEQEESLAWERRQSHQTLHAQTASLPRGPTRPCHLPVHHATTWPHRP